MKLENPWIGYLERSYKQIKNSLITKLTNSVPEITDHSESNILIIILSMFAGLTEQLNYYVDLRARESFLSTARKFSSVYKLTRILDYRIKSFLAASVDIYITYVDEDGVPVITTEEAIIPSGTVIRTLNGIPFVSVKTISVPAGSSYAIVPTRQWEKVDDEELGITTNQPLQSYQIPGAYVNNTLELTIDDVPWILQSTLARSLPTDKHYIVDVNQDEIPLVRFGNGINGAIPPANKTIIADYYTTQGKSGNDISEDTINQLDGVLVLPAPAVGIIVTNKLQPVGGADIETVEEIRNNAPLTIRTLERAVTIQDFKDLLVTAPGVAKGEVIYNCGIKVNNYIAPNGGGIASSLLLEDTYNYMNELKIINREIIMHAAGITPVVVKAKVLARFRADKVQTKLDVEQVLTDDFSFDAQEINGRVAISDVIAAIDNLKRVDTVEIEGLYTLPYPFPLGHQVPLSWNRETLPTSGERAVWRLIYAGPNFRLLYNNAFLATVNINQQYTDPKLLITFKILNGGYTIGQVWEFTSYPYNKTIRMDDNTIPVIIGGQTTIITVE